MNKKTIYIDLDDTLAHTSHYIKTLFEYESYLINYHPLKKSFSDILKDISTWMHIRNNPDFWQNIPISQVAQQIYQQANEITDDIYILSALPKFVYPFKNARFFHAEKAKRKWLSQYFPQIPENKIIICYAKDKHLQINNAKGLPILIDDSWRNIYRWKKHGGIAVHVEEHQLNKVFEKLEFLKNSSLNNADLINDFNYHFFTP